MENKIVKVIFDKDGYILRAGDFTTLSKKEKNECTEVLLDGGTIKEMPLQEFKQLNNKWVFEKK